MHELTAPEITALAEVQAGFITITTEDLPSLRSMMTRYAEDTAHSKEFRAVCLAAIDAIDQARDEDEATHAPLEASLIRFVEAGEAEAIRFGRLIEAFAVLDEANDPAVWRAKLAELVPLLSDQHVIGLRALIIEAAADFAVPEICQ
ncbi:MAG: hypothetical protein IT512_12000 [Rhodocyclaceae bacterium]|nr:hypothetical protein [Rhodocyclaceae bacterium]